MQSELTRPLLVTWEAFEKKPKTWKKSLKLFLTAMLGFALIYMGESLYLDKRAHALVDQAEIVKQSIISNLGHDSSTALSDHGVFTQLRQTGAIKNAAGLLTSETEFSDIWVVRAEAKSSPYVVFFLEDSSIKLAEYLAVATKREGFSQPGGHCDAAELRADGRLSFCLEL
ncbi:MAG: hypothetical protein QGI45_01770 [Myxococcota bacterium]|nr:hypothetical protein [Myxococcota bacterium]